ncbi:MAG: sensor histidine kinase N-terminal domain-containing protein [Casimicrobiaceae bacterium]
MPRPDQSLRQRLLKRLWMPLLGVLVVGGFLCFGLARHFGNVVHDRWLLDSAMALATQLQSGAAGPKLNLSRSAVEMFEWDSVDRIYENVISADGERLFGNVEFPSLPNVLPMNQPFYYDEIVAGVPVRLVAITVAGPAPEAKIVTIQVAETIKKRQTLVREIILMLVPLQAAILLAAGAFIWFAVTSSLAKLDETAARLRRYKPDGLVPLYDDHDVPSEVKPLIGAINQLIEKLAEARGAQQRFVANAAHQLRTPLAALQVQTERALRETIPHRHGEALGDIAKAVSRMRHLTQQLLTLSRSDPSSQGILQMNGVDLAQFARVELERWADQAIGRNIDLGYEGPDTGVLVSGEQQLLGELLGNLVDNAIRYGKAGGRITVGVATAPVSLFVEDDGPGIPPAERERVFEPFYRPRNSSSGGCGLGLTIAREIAARHGAQLTIADPPQARGTRIEVVFAAVANPAQSVAPASADSVALAIS